MRNCAYCIETLNGCINSDVQVKDLYSDVQFFFFLSMQRGFLHGMRFRWLQVPQNLKSHVRDACMVLCLHSSDVLKELACCLKSMTRSAKLSHLTGEMNFAAQRLQDTLKTLPSQLIVNHPSPLEVVPLVTMVSLLIEIATRIEGLADGVMEFAEMAEFKAQDDKTMEKIRPVGTPDETTKDKDTTKS